MTIEEHIKTAMLNCPLTEKQEDALLTGIENYFSELDSSSDQNNKQLVIPDVSNWVAITDALPNANEEVLTITADGWYRVMTYGSTGSRFPSQVIHWMHLPKPPCC